MTTTTPKVAKPSSFKPRKTGRASFYRDLAAEMKRLTGKKWNPGYLSNLVTGVKTSEKLDREGTLVKAIANLKAKAA